MRRVTSLIGMNNKRNIEKKSLLAIYICIMLILGFLALLIGAKGIIGPYSRTAGADSKTISYYLMMLCYSLMTISAGIFFDVMYPVPMLEDQMSGNVEAILATRVSQKELWVSKSIALFLPSILVSYAVVIAVAFILKVRYFTGSLQLLFNPWLTVTTFIIVPLVYLQLSLLMNLVGLRYGVPGGIILSTIIGPGYAALFINLGARNVFDAQNWQFMVANIALGAVLLIINLALLKKLDKEKIILLCRK